MFRTGLGILRLYEDILLQMDFIHIAQFLTKLPEDITSEKLFSCIAAIQMQNSNKKWAQVSFLDIRIKTHGLMSAHGALLSDSACQTSEQWVMLFMWNLVLD